MAATTTHSTISKRNKIIADHPQFKFSPAQLSLWSPQTKTVFYEDSSHSESLVDTLHELGHALLEHADFKQDIELIKMESEAWQVAQNLADKYKIELNDQQITDSLDSYRQWLHARSRCPSCQQPGVQKTDGAYGCLLCRTVWRANDARQCGLKRYKK